jgi:hypothetical protein
MRQGRSHATLIRCLLLLVTAVQGLTPDHDDLASSRALVLLCPSSPDNPSFQIDDDSPDEVCEILESFQTGWVVGQADDLPHDGLTIPATSAQSTRSGIRGFEVNLGVMTRYLSLHDQLIRLLC